MFIELHYFSNGRPVMINIRHIISIESGRVTTTQQIISVQEDYEDIEFKIKTAIIADKI